MTEHELHEESERLIDDAMREVEEIKAVLEATRDPARLAARMTELSREK